MCVIEEYTDIYPADVRRRRVLQRCLLGKSVGYCYRTRVVNLGERFHDRPTTHFYAQPRPVEMNSLRHRVDPREPPRPARRSRSFRILFPFLRRSPDSDDEPSPRGRARSRPYASTPDVSIQREPPQIRVVSPRVPTRPPPHRPRPPRTPHPVVIHQELRSPARPARYRARPAAAAAAAAAAPPPPPPAPPPQPAAIVPPPTQPPTPPVKVRPPRERSPVTEREPIRKTRSTPSTPVQINNPPTPRPEPNPARPKPPPPRHVRFSDTVDHVTLSSDASSLVFPPRYYSRFSSSAIHRDHSPSSYGHRRPSSPFPAPRRYTYVYPADPRSSTAPQSPGRYRQYAPAPAPARLRSTVGGTGHPAQVRTPAQIIEEGRPLYERARAYEELQRRRQEEEMQASFQGRWRPLKRGSDRYTAIRSGDERIARDQGYPSRRWHWP
ncbi:uncharacterized protein BO80DRAFT_425227 [Aspergillus ibericus CBS 121593]|uniref:Uncharacterized protein n=1 Tax=Aspergillus ibericus CBS 121593 TaxID=1448316 RepID=A0A395GZ37_9EURO|nr:hypothetical protein BO80DRAFT_425227 [Aspergillus ibericus CBS 121593]RAL00826.1 hypothetical protein BO80DRAFT_425227 [Aspergillus ibericus CBS 121593]